MIRLLKEKSLEDKLNVLKEKIHKKLSKNKFEKVEKLMAAYNNSLDSLWAARPSKYPMQRMKCLDKKNSRILYETGKCNFGMARRIRD